MRILEFREVKQLAQSHTAARPDLNPELAEPPRPPSLYCSAHLLPALTSLPHQKVPQGWDHTTPTPHSILYSHQQTDRLAERWE